MSTRAVLIESPTVKLDSARTAGPDSKASGYDFVAAQGLCG
jgi:hypothetical protein